ncbi:MAG: 50S ribosomal protein L17 [Actinobacteria bacterium]|nr:50S ribosomal protein L17 [Actinomycetota bacterium]
MVKPKKGPRLGSDSSHQKAMLRNLAISLIEHKRIRTTEAKAKVARSLVDKAVTFAKRADLAARRRCLQLLDNEKAVRRLFEEVAPKYENREGGYTRILKIGDRPGDNAPMVYLELVDLEPQKKKSPKKRTASKK